MTWLWLIEDLVDPACAPVPLARVGSGGLFEWAPGEPRERRSAFVNELVHTLPDALALGVSYDSPHCNIFEGRAW